MTKSNSGHHSNIPVPEIVAQLTGRAEVLCRELLPAGHREGAEWRCGSVEGEPGKSLGVRLTGAKAGKWSDFAGDGGGDLLDLIQTCLGLDKGEAVQWAKNWLGIGDVDRPATAPRVVPDRKKAERSDDSAARTRAAARIWCASRKPAGTLTGSYLCHRYITSTIPATIRDHPSLWHSPTLQNRPAMVTAITGADRKVIAIQRTFLRRDGRGKANVDEPKMTLGPMRDSAVRLGPAGPVLGIAEGVETGLSAMQLFDVPVWCSLSAARLDGLWLPPESVEVHIFADNGDRGYEAAEQAARVYLAQGRRIVKRFPPERFGDWNDALKDFNDPLSEVAS